MELKGEHIPKATMTSYLKDKVGKTKISTEFVEGILSLAKEYITRISNRANQLCTSQNKKTISLDHLYKAVEHFNLKGQIQELKKIEVEVKGEVEIKHAIKLKIQRSYEEMIQNGEIQPFKREVSIVRVNEIRYQDPFKKDDEDNVDYEEQEEDNDNKQKNSHQKSD